MCKFIDIGKVVRAPNPKDYSFWLHKGEEKVKCTLQEYTTAAKSKYTKAVLVSDNDFKTVESFVKHRYYELTKTTKKQTAKTTKKQTVKSKQTRDSPKTKKRTRGAATSDQTRDSPKTKKRTRGAATSNQTPTASDADAETEEEISRQDTESSFSASGDGDEHDSKDDSKDGDSDSNDDDVKKVFESASDGDGDNHGSSENGDNSEHGSDGDGDSASDDVECYVSVPDAAKWKPLNVPRLHVRQKNRAVRAMMAAGIRFRDSKPGFYNMAIRAAACFKVGVTRTP